MTNKAIAKNKAIYELLRKYKNEDSPENLGLSYGFIPDNLKAEFLALEKKYLIETKGQVDTDYDKSLFSAWFYTENNKILSKEKQGSGYINPVITVGNINDIDSMIPYQIQKMDSTSSKEETPQPEVKKETVRKEKKIGNMTNKELAISKVVSNFEKEPQNSTAEILTIEESLKIYSPNITTAEIKGYVYYKQKFGSPMFGWEKWFLPSVSNRGRLAYATNSFALKNQQFEDVKNVPSGTLLGVKTKFKNEYDNEVFWVIKNENKELYYASEKNFNEIDSFATVDDAELVKLVIAKGLCYDGDDYVPVYMYVFGDIFDIKEKLIGKYNRETDKFEGGYKEKLIEKFGLETAKWQESLIDNALKTKYNFDFANTIVSERPYLSKENDLSHNYMIIDLDIDSGVSIKTHFDDYDRSNRRKKQYDYLKDYGKQSVSLFEAYEIWFGYNVNNNMLEKTTVDDIKNLYFRNGNVFLSEASKEKSKKDQDKEKDERRILAKIEGDKYYSEFLATALTRADLIGLNLMFNKSFNNFVSYDLSRVPVGFEANSTPLGVPNFRLKPVQRDGLAFLNINNSGCLAYDVGFGKTLTAIHNLAMLLKQGSIKRPLIAVPKQVYKNWIYEMFGYWTNGAERNTVAFADSHFVNGALTGSKYKLNDWFNLGTNRSVENRQIPEYTITLVTYQGLEKIGFSEKLHQEIADDFYEILNVKKEKETDRSIEKEKEKTENLVGKALAKTEYDIDVLGFDYMVLDEAHAFKNIFSSFAIPEEFRDTWRIGKGTQSSRALKAFTLSLYIQKRFNGNVNMLTATPFTNSPMELYSMLSMVGYNYLVSSNINNLFNFMSLFIETQVEYTVDHLQNIVLNTVIKSFKNKNILRDVLYRYFDYQDNPELCGIKRPCKINFPNNQTSTFLQMSDLQIEAQAMVIEEADSYDRETNRGAVGRALSWAKSNAFSPYLIPNIEKYDNLDDFINESPKIKYTIECIKTVKEFHENLKQECSGQVIYSNRGKDLFNDFKKALEQECGFVKGVKFGSDKVDEVEIITSSGTEAESDRKELIKDAFNEGYVKVIIGTATIQEGINLQKRGTVLYNLDLDWNPTSFKQLEGRIYRQQNTFKFVRIVVPMLQDSLDSFINQKLDEKTKRIASVWDKENTLNDYSVSDALDPMEIKFNLIKDENKLVAMRLDINKEKAKKDFAINEDKYKTFSKLNQAVTDFEYYKKDNINAVESTVNNLKKYLQMIDKYVSEKDSEWNKTNKRVVGDLKTKIQEVLDMYDDYQTNGVWKSLFEFKRACENRSFVAKTKSEYSDDYEINYRNLARKYDNDYYAQLSSFNTWSFGNFIASYGNAKKLEKNLLQPYGLTMFDDFSNIEKEYLNNFEKAKYNLEYLDTPEYQESVLYEIRNELEKRQGNIGSLQDRVDGFAKTNYLLTYPFKNEEKINCDIPENINLESVKYIKEELKLTEYLDVDDMDLLTTKKKFKKIKDFFNPSELKVVQANVSEYSDSIINLYKYIKDIPELDATDGDAEKMVYLHYFSSSSDWYVIELGKGDIFDDDNEMQKEAFGYAILNGDMQNAEYGYMNIDEIKEYAELDLYFTPQNINDIIRKHEGQYDYEEMSHELDKATDIVEQEVENPEVTEIKEFIETLQLIFEYSSKKEKKQITETIEGLEILLSTY
jgi:hypothetical protein